MMNPAARNIVKKNNAMVAANECNMGMIAREKLKTVSSEKVRRSARTSAPDFMNRSVAQPQKK